jgi:hypothetical protein
VKVFTPRGNDWTKRFRKIADDAWHISAGSAIIDGEVVVPGESGTTDFSILQNELKGKSKKIVLVAFDLLYLNGYDLRKLPLIERKVHLKKTIDGTDIQFSESFEVDGAEMYAHACKVGLEGVVSKVRDSAYISGRGNNWVKKTCAQRETLTRWFRARRQQVGRHLRRPAQGRGSDLCRQGRPRLRQDLGDSTTQATDAADPQDPALHQADRAQGHLGRTGVASRDRVPRQIRRGQGAPSLLQGPAGGPVMDIYDDAEWTAMDIEDLRAAIEHGRSIQEAAEFLCRAGTVDEVARKAKELGLKPPDGN